jgi:hypothetical protein
LPVKRVGEKEEEEKVRVEQFIFHDFLNEGSD